MPSTKNSFILLLLFSLQITFFPLAFASQDPDSDPFYAPDPVLPPTEPLELIPGITKTLLIKLQGQEEEITFSFQADEADPSIFETLILINKKIEATHVFNFTTQETLTVSLDYSEGQCVISGDNGFSLKSAIHEQNYQIDVIHDKGAGYQEQIVVEPTTSTAGAERTLVLSATAGAFGLLVLGVKFGYLAKKKRKSVILGDVSEGTCNTEEDLAKKSTSESTVITHQECETEENYKEYIGSLSEVPLKSGNLDTVKPPPKKVSPKSQASTACTLGGIVPCSVLKQGNKTHMKFTDEDNANSCETEKEKKKTKPEIKKSKPEIKKQPFKEDKEQEKFELSLDLDIETDRDPRRAPTAKDIRALVKKMEAEGTIGYDCDPSAESDDEEQYEAPVLPDYFCCMLCFQGKRCTMVQPCRHIFSCTGCVEDLLNSYKICVMCANEITGYEPL